MKLLYPLIILLFIGCESKPQYTYENLIIDSWKNGNIEKELVYRIHKDEKNLYKMKMYYESGELECVYDVISLGKNLIGMDKVELNGLMECFNKNGILSGTRFYKNGKKEGRMYRYNEDGSLKDEYCYKNDKEVDCLLLDGGY